MAKTQFSFLLMVVYILCAGTTKGVHGQCTTPPINMAVYEETQNVTLMCNSPTKVSWTLKATTEEVNTYLVTKYNDVVTATLRNLYDVNQTGLVAKIAQGAATVPPISTAGLYVILINGSSTKYGTKLTVVRQLPTCNCTVVSATKINITCSLSYADTALHPVNTTMTWTSNGNFYKTDTPVRKKSGAYYVSTSVITVDSFYAANYQCNVAFGKPYDVQFLYVATNTPAFSASCTPPSCRTNTTTPPNTTDLHPATPSTAVVGQCTTPPINLAVYDGTENISMMCGSPTKVSWTLKPTTYEQNIYFITYYNDVVITAYKNLFDVDSSNLLIKTGQGVATVAPISTAGLYVILINGSTTKYGAKLTVVRQAPTCNCTAVNSTKNNITCSLTYADSAYNPIDATMTWTSDGNFYKTDIPATNEVSGYYVSTSILTVDANDPANYECNVTFGRPMNIPYLYVATNAPDFSASCTIPKCNRKETKVCSSPDPNCTQTKESCVSDGTDLTDIYSECVVKAELYININNCCFDALMCGVVVTIRNNSRWLIHDPQCDDNKCEMVVAIASCMSNDWKLFAERNIVKSGVGDYVQSGSSVYNVTDCSESCKRLMSLP